MGPEDLADDPEHVRGAPGWAHVALRFAREEQKAHPVLVADGGEGKDRADLGCEFALRLLMRAGLLGCADIHHEHEVVVRGNADHRRSAWQGFQSIKRTSPGRAGFIEFDAAPRRRRGTPRRGR
jgi:hypothetical protein